MKTKLAKVAHIILLSFTILVLFSSCQKDYERSYHRTFVALAWDGVEPTYIDAGTAAIPAHFEYNSFYRITPGFYQLYYEGTDYYNGYYRDYAWDMEYEIYVIEDEYAYEGYDDSYFTLELNPWGPEVFESVKSGKNEISGYNVLEYSNKKVVLEKAVGSMGIKITYNRKK